LLLNVWLVNHKTTTYHKLVWIPNLDVAQFILLHPGKLRQSWERDHRYKNNMWQL